MIYKLIIISIFFVNSLLFGDSNALTASQSSIIPFQLLPKNNPMILVGTLRHSETIQPLSGMQIQPTKNLLLGGILSTKKIDEDISIYYQLLIGYIPNWKFLKLSSNMIQIALHRHQYNQNYNSKWVSLSISESANFRNLKLNLCWSKLFSNKWESDTIILSTRIKLIENIYFQPGSIAHFTPEFNYSPFILLNISL